MSATLAVLTRSPRTLAGVLAVPFYFQAGPIETFAFETAMEFSDYATISGHRFSRPVGEQLTTYTLDTMFTDYLMDDVPHALQGYVDKLTRLGLNPQKLDAISTHPFFAPPEDRLNQLRHIQAAKTPLVLTMADSSIIRAPGGGQLAAGSTGAALSVEVTLRSVRQEERAGEVDAIYVQCTFVGYHVVQLKTAKRGGTKGSTATGDTKLTILRLDSPRCTVARLAKHYYGDASKVGPIFSKNKWLADAKVGRNENLRAIAAGDVRQTTRMKSLKALFKKHPQILIPPLRTAAATTKVSTQTYVGGR
jgi:hypothetical protein